jgi:hypothetical protein
VHEGKPTITAHAHEQNTDRQLQTYRQTMAAHHAEHVKRAAQNAELEPQLPKETQVGLL